MRPIVFIVPESEYMPIKKRKYNPGIAADYEHVKGKIKSIKTLISFWSHYLSKDEKESLSSVLNDLSERKPDKKLDCNLLSELIMMVLFCDRANQPLLKKELKLIEKSISFLKRCTMVDWECSETYNPALKSIEALYKQTLFLIFKDCQNPTRHKLKNEDLEIYEFSLVNYLIRFLSDHSTEDTFQEPKPNSPVTEEACDYASQVLKALGASPLSKKNSGTGLLGRYKRQKKIDQYYIDDYFNKGKPL